MPQRLLAAEVTREQVFLQLHDELPYASTVETESWEEFKNGSVKISQTIYVQRDSQKAIVLGHHGGQIKRIGARARAELEKLFDRRVHLFLFVKVREDWTDDRERYDAMRLDYRGVTAVQWSDEAIILAARPHGETSLIVQLLTREHGRHAGLVRGARKARGRGVYEIGNRVEASWQARLAEHLGMLRCELVAGCAAGLIDDPARLACLAAAAAVAEAALPERETVPRCFDGLGEVLSALSLDRDWAQGLRHLGARAARRARLRPRSHALRRDRHDGGSRLCLAQIRPGGVARGRRALSRQAAAPAGLPARRPRRRPSGATSPTAWRSPATSSRVTSSPRSIGNRRRRVRDLLTGWGRARQYIAGQQTLPTISSIGTSWPRPPLSERFATSTSPTPSASATSPMRCRRSSPARCRMSATG